MLPASLVDLLCQRLYAQPNPSAFYIQGTGHIRRVQQLALQRTAHRHELHPQKIPRPHKKLATRDGYSLRVRQAREQVQAVSELQDRVAALNDTASLVAQTDSISQEGPHFHEAVLQNIYRDLLASPDPSTTSSAEKDNNEIIKEAPLDMVQTLEERLPVFETALRAHAGGTGLAHKLQARMTGLAPAVDLPVDLSSWTSGPALRVLVNRLRAVLDALPSTRQPTDTDSSTLDMPSVPLGLLSNTEWGALLQSCLEAEDASAAQLVLDLMKRSGLVPPDEQYDAVLNWFATRGLVEDADSYMSQLAIDIPRERQRDLLVKARIKANRLDEACALVHLLETRALPAPMQSYTRVIQALLSQRGPGSERHKAQAWDMFSHMRYVAHATADEFLHSVMIRACAGSSSPEPERALDLFTEMTVEKGIAPTTHAYNAVILTCARSKKFALEAFRLAREMLNSHRDAHGAIPARLQPDKSTFSALLEAAKRLGDLPRARWILAQMTQNMRDAREGERSVYIDEKIMTHVFHAYAAYRTPFRREAVLVVPGEGAEDQHAGEHNEASSETRDMQATSIRRYRGAPQSRQEVIKEVSTLWSRILEDRRAIEESGDDPSNPGSLFARVSLTPSLLNAYMAVHYAHSPPSASYKVYTNLFEPLEIQRDAFTYVLALEAYAAGRRASDSELRIALSFARDIWKDWQGLENAGVNQLSDVPAGSGVDARTVERAWSAMMRMLALNGHLHEAIALLREFVARYSPSLVKTPSPPDPSRSTRTRLYAERPLVRLTERSAVPEDRISPFLTFDDLGLLHHRAVAANRKDLINYIDWVAHAYQGSLRRRRDATLRGTA